MKAPSTMQKSVHKSLVENKKPVEEWTSEQVSAWLIHVGFDQEIADNFKGNNENNSLPGIHLNN